MPGETDLHKLLKREACRWLIRMGYRCVAAEVRLDPLGIIDAVGTGIFRPWQNQLHLPREVAQTCFIECKATRSDFLRDQSDQAQFAFCIAERANRARRRGPRRSARRYRQAVGLGKFLACLAQPMANLHYILAPAGVVKKDELPARWGLLTYGTSGISVVNRAGWQELSAMAFVESQIARTLTADIYNADRRAMNSVNREIFAQQQQLAGKIRSIRPMLFDPEQHVG